MKTGVRMTLHARWVERRRGSDPLHLSAAGNHAWLPAVFGYPPISGR